MNVKEIFTSLFPRPRASLTLGAALPLVVFLCIFAGICLYLELSNTLLFARPAAFGLLLVTPWMWWMHFAGYGGLSRARGTFALMTRLALTGAFVMMMAEPRAVRTRDVLSVVYALDISDSIGDGSTDAALRFINRTVTEKPSMDEAGLVVFGRNSAVELPPRMSFPFEAINSRIDRDATNLEQSLSLAAAMLPEENRGRIVLITDGTETTGNLSQVLEELKAREIAVDVLPIQYDYTHEVWLERLELPQYVKLGENYEASIILSALTAGKGKLVLRENGQAIFDKEVEFEPGKNRFVVPIYLREPGYYEYAATIETARDNDHLLQNNTVMNYIFIEGEGKVLIVTDPDPESDDRDWQTLAQAVQEGKRSVEVVSAYDFPRDSLSLMPYDCIVYVNVGADAFDAVQLQSTRDAVFNLGLGFMMVGGANSFGPGGYHRTVIEDALPVTMDITKKKVLPKGALVIILHTCEFPEGNTWGKRITKQAIKVLGDQDEVGVLAYSFTPDTPSGEGWVFELTPAGDYEKLVPKINAAEVGDMPSFTSTMRLGLEGLEKSDAAAKHMIIISDGDPSPPPPSLVSKFRAAQVSVSMVAIFPHGGQDISKMRSIASVTGGRYYFPADPNQLPAIFIKESKTLKRSMIQNKTVQPRVGFSSPVLRGIEALPPLHGYVLTTAKDGHVETILEVETGNQETPEIDPILSTWRYGLGTTAAFTSDLSPNWGKDWTAWDKYQPFISQVITKISRVRKEGHLRMWTYTAGNEGVVLVEDFHPDESFLEISARVSGPRSTSETVTLKQVGPRRYQANVPLWGKGRYQVMVVGKAGDRTDHANGGFIVPYSPEYLRFRSNPIVLEEVAKSTGGAELTEDASAELIYGRREPKSSSRPIFDWFLVAIICLIPLDVAVRRIQLDYHAIKSWFGMGRKDGVSTQTMGALLQRKRDVDSGLDARRAEPLPARHKAGSPQGRKPDKPRPAAHSGRRQDVTGEEPPRKSETLSTTERLLDLKRRREQDKS